MKKVAVIFALGCSVAFLVMAFQPEVISFFHLFKAEKEAPIELSIVNAPTYPASDIGHIVPESSSLGTEAKAEEIATIKTEQKAKILSCPKANTLSLDAFLYPMSKTFSINEMYIPETLVRVPTAYVKNDAFICVTTDTLASLTDMFDDAQKEDYTLYVTSGFRSGATQQSLFDYYTSVMGLMEAERRSAYPGHSEHQLGTTVDVTGGTTPATSQTFGTTPEGMWIKEHAREYGFVLSYQEGKEEVTGYMYEPWHLRYVGEEVAEEVADEELTLGEYLFELYEIGRASCRERVSSPV